MASSGTWNEDDHSFHDVLPLNDGSHVRLRVRSLVGPLPIVASTSSRSGPGRRRSRIGADPGSSSSPERIAQILEIVFDEGALLSPHGIRGLSAEHRDRPFTLSRGGRTATVGYEPAESTTPVFGGDSNRRGPVVPARRAPERSPRELRPRHRGRADDRVPARVWNLDFVDAGCDAGRATAAGSQQCTKWRFSGHGGARGTAARPRSVKTSPRCG